MSEFPAATARTFLDFEGLGRLRGQSRDAQSPQALREAAQQFEAQLLHMMLESMRKSVVRDEESASAAQDLYQEMMDREVALLVARRGGVGLADMLERQLGAREATAPAEPDTWRVLGSREAVTGLPLAPASGVKNDE
jgi:peptidoglycan hydrolase FlgJ